jgi:hypothetical protein
MAICVCFYSLLPIPVKHTVMNFFHFSGPLNVRPTDYVKEEDIFRMIRTIIADYDHTGLQFPIQKFILGERALQVRDHP